ncbi:MAG: NPCBM/NEW2 domain-containing protein [Chloroflexi bacterium]|nr:NPCBM/NEW2 domain-containing protein [Chloroflexota bacterium]
MGRRVWLVVAGCCLLLFLLLSWRLRGMAVTLSPEGSVVGEWVWLSELSWHEASTGWLGVANQQRPALDRAFAGGPLSLAGETFDRGLGTVPVSEIVYHLDGLYDQFTARIGVDDATPPGPNGARFLLFVDEVLRYESDVLRRGDPPVVIEVTLNGARALRLAVVDVRQTETPLYADWADARLLRPVVGTPLFDRAWQERVRSDRARRTAQQVEDEGDLAARSAELLAEIERASGQPDQRGVQVIHEPAAGWVALGNQHLVFVLGLDGVWRGRLGLVDRRSRRLVFDRVSPAVSLDRSAEPTYRLATDAEPGRWTAEEVEAAPFGRGRRVVAEYPLRDGSGVVVVRLALFAERPYVLYDLAVRGAIDTAGLRFHFLDPGAGETVLGGGAEYVTSFSRLRHAAIQDDGMLRRESIGPGQPLYLWSEQSGRGLLLAAIDEANGPTRFAVQRQAGSVVGRIGLSAGPRREPRPADEAASPRLYVELPPSVDLRASHAGFKRIMAALYPPAPLPAWVKYQWISWYAFNVAIDEEKLRAQIDYIAENLADLGPWHVLVDAGWYVAEGREGAEWRNVDRAKFPSGLRALVDYAHSRGVRVVGYISTPYLDSRRRSGDWLGLRKIIEEHPDWLIELGGDETRQSFAFDFDRPAVRAYWAAVISDLLIEYDMDGIKIDGLGNAEGALLTPDTVDFFGLVDTVADQAMDIYRFVHREATALKPDAFLLAGWLIPVVANPYAHAFYYGDDFPAFSNPYPFPGLQEKVDYAIVQRRLLGQRSNMGNVYEPPNGSTINRWWLGAGLALGTQVALSFDLTTLSPEALAAYRSLLVHSNAFAGETRFGPGLFPDYFATTVRDTTSLGLINRADLPRRITASLAGLGLDPGMVYTAYDVEEGRFFQVSGDLAADLAGRSFRLIILRREPGVLWTNSSFTARLDGRRLDLTVRGPAGIRGSLHLAAPEPAAVTMDGRPLRAIEPDDRSRSGYWYDATAGVLHLQYSHRFPRRIRVTFP